MVERIRLAFVGCGQMGHSHLNAYRRLVRRGADFFDIVAVCDPAVDSAAEFKQCIEGFQEAPVTVYSDLEEMLEHEALHCVDTASPHFLHHTIATTCIEAGLDVMVEKPLGLTIKAARLMCETAKKNGRILATAEQVRRWTGPRTVKWALDQGLIGAPRSFFMHNSGGIRDEDPDAAGPPSRFTWRQDKITSGGWILDGGVHHADLLLYLFGPVETVYAFTASVEQAELRKLEGHVVAGAGAESSNIAQLYFAGGVVGTWTQAGRVGRQINHLVYYGSRGSIFSERGYPVDPQLQRWNGEIVEAEALKTMFVESLDEEEREQLFPRAVLDDPVRAQTAGYYDEEGDYGVALECYDFLCAVRERRPPELDGWAGLEAQAIPEGFFESSHLGQVVRIADVVDGKVENYQREINDHWGL